MLGVKIDENSVVADLEKIYKSEHHKMQSDRLKESKVRWTDDIEIVPPSHQSYIRVVSHLRESNDVKHLQSLLETNSISSVILQRELQDAYDLNAISNVTANNF